MVIQRRFHFSEKTKGECTLRTVTFSMECRAVNAVETFTLEELGLEEITNETQLNDNIHRIFRAWVERELNISWSIIIK